jgi:tRNA nucleotidyltransferase/poly(A) polymerase
VKRFLCGAITLPLFAAGALHAQGQSINDLKGKIFDARMTKQTFAASLKFCDELDGKNFYFAPRERVLNLEEYHRSLDSLALQRAFNPETRKPWSEEDAAKRWEEVKRQAIGDKANCALVASLPELEKQLDELEKKAQATEPATEKKN